MSSTEELREQAHAQLEAHLSHNPQLLAAAKAQMEEQLRSNPEAFRGQMDNTPEGQIKKCQQWCHYDRVTKALDGTIEDFFTSAHADNRRSKQKRFAAVDLASGPAYFTYRWALRYREPSSTGSLEWYPTDTREGLENATRPCLRYLLAAAREEPAAAAAAAHRLCADRNGDDVFPRQRVELRGLSVLKYNGREGMILNEDPQTAGRYAIQLDGSPKPMSFKAENLVRNDDSNNEHERSEGRDLLAGLLERSCQVDVLKPETWSYLRQKLKRQCALVTCTNLLTEIGHREPTAWKRVLELASELLVSGGILLHGDADGWGQFGTPAIMKDHALTLGMTLHQQVKLEAWELVLWKKL